MAQEFNAPLYFRFYQWRADRYMKKASKVFGVKKKIIEDIVKMKKRDDEEASKRTDALTRLLKDKYSEEEKYKKALHLALNYLNLSKMYDRIAFTKYRIKNMNKDRGSAIFLKYDSKRQKIIWEDTPERFKEVVEEGNKK